MFLLLVNLLVMALAGSALESPMITLTLPTGSLKPLLKPSFKFFKDIVPALMYGQDFELQLWNQLWKASNFRFVKMYFDDHNSWASTEEDSISLLLHKLDITFKANLWKNGQDYGSHTIRFFFEDLKTTLSGFSDNLDGQITIRKVQVAPLLANSFLFKHVSGDIGIALRATIRAIEAISSNSESARIVIQTALEKELPSIISRILRRIVYSIMIKVPTSTNAQLFTYFKHNRAPKVDRTGISLYLDLSMCGSGIDIRCPAGFVTSRRLAARSLLYPRITTNQLQPFIAESFASMVTIHDRAFEFLAMLIEKNVLASGGKYALDGRWPVYEGVFVRRVELSDIAFNALRLQLDQEKSGIMLEVVDLRFDTKVFYEYSEGLNGQPSQSWVKFTRWALKNFGTSTNSAVRLSLRQPTRIRAFVELTDVLKDRASSPREGVAVVKLPRYSDIILSNIPSAQFEGESKWLDIQKWTTRFGLNCLSTAAAACISQLRDTSMLGSIFDGIIGNLETRINQDLLTDFSLAFNWDDIMKSTMFRTSLLRTTTENAIVYRNRRITVKLATKMKHEDL